MNHGPYDLGDLWDHDRPADDLAMVDPHDPDTEWIAICPG